MLYVDLWDNDEEDNDALAKAESGACGRLPRVPRVRSLRYYVTLRFSQVEAKPLYTLLYSVVLYSFSRANSGWFPYFNFVLYVRIRHAQALLWTAERTREADRSRDSTPDSIARSLSPALLLSVCSKVCTYKSIPWIACWQPIALVRPVCLYTLCNRLIELSIHNPSSFFWRPIVAQPCRSLVFHQSQERNEKLLLFPLLLLFFSFSFV